MNPQDNLNTQVSPKRKRRIGGMVWLLIGIAILFTLGGVFSALRKTVTRPKAKVPSSFVGISEFQDAEGGVTFRDVWPPAGPADKAGLVGGDILLAFDGHATVNKDTMNDLLSQTPPGKTLEVIYLRDGEQKKAELTTVPGTELEKLESAFINRGTSGGQLGFEDVDEVAVSGTKMRGILFEKLNPNGPAALAGIREGDIIIEFEGVPIRTVSELVLRSRRAIPYSTVHVIVMRGTEKLKIAVKVGKRG